MSHNTRFKRELLIFYLDKYLQKKKLKMKDFMQNIRFKLLQRNKISLRQFESILEFLKREDAFKPASDQRIINYFRPLITGVAKEKKHMSQQQYQNYNNGNYKLINFNVPHYLINNFDEIVKFKRISRTSVLIGLMERYIRAEHQCLAEDGKLNKLISDIKNRNQQPEPLRRPKIEERYSPPEIPEIHDWQDRLSEMGK